MNRKEYIDTYLTMISLRGLTDHTLKSYKTYISLTVRSMLRSPN